MKLFGKYSEYSINDIYLYATPLHVIKKLIVKPGSTTIVKEYKPRKFKKILKDENGKEFERVDIQQDKSYRHQVVVIQDLDFIKISIYSTPLDRKDIKELGLKPVESAVRKEKLELAVEKLSDKPGHRGLQTTRSDIINGTVVKK